MLRRDRMMVTILLRLYFSQNFGRELPIGNRIRVLRSLSPTHCGDGWASSQTPVYRQNGRSPRQSTLWCWLGEQPHLSPGQPQGSPHPLTTTPALTMIPMLSHLATVCSPAHYCSLVSNVWGLLRI